MKKRSYIQNDCLNELTPRDKKLEHFILNKYFNDSKSKNKLNFFEIYKNQNEQISKNEEEKKIYTLLPHSQNLSQSKILFSNNKQKLLQVKSQSLQSTISIQTKSEVSYLFYSMSI